MHFGHFSDDGSEYVITRFPTPRPWENFLSNHEYGVKVEETGAGYSVLPASPGCRVTFASAGEPFSKVFYLRDRDSGHHWSLTSQPVAHPYDTFQCRHGLGYTIFVMSCEGVETELRVFVPLNDPVEIWTATMRNTGSRPRSLTLFPYLEWHLAPYLKPWDNYRNYIAAHWSSEEQLVIGEVYDPAHPGQTFVGFAGVGPAPGSWDTERAVFVGEFLVGDRVLLHPVLRGIDHTGAAGEPDPFIVGGAIGRRDRRIERRRMDRLSDTGISGLREIADIDGEQHIGRAVAPFGLDALDQALLGEDHIDLDAGLLGEFLEQGVDQIRLAVRIDIDLARLDGLSGCCGEGEDKKRKRKRAREGKSHRFLQWPGFKAPVSDLRLGPRPDAKGPHSFA